MKLYWAPRSPFVRKVVVAAIELGLDQRIEKIHCEPSEAGPDFFATAPVGKIPTLVTDQGTSLPQSSLIVAYLDGLAGPKLIPTEAPARWAALRLEALADGFMEAAVERRDEDLRPEGERSRAQLAKLMTRMNRCLDALEPEAPRFGDEVTIGQIAAGCACGYADLRYPGMGWRDNRPALAAWFGRFDQRPSMAATRPYL